MCSAVIGYRCAFKPPMNVKFQRLLFYFAPLSFLCWIAGSAERCLGFKCSVCVTLYCKNTVKSSVLHRLRFSCTFPNIILPMPFLLFPDFTTDFFIWRQF